MIDEHIPSRVMLLVNNDYGNTKIEECRERAHARPPLPKGKQTGPNHHHHAVTTCMSLDKSKGKFITEVFDKRDNFNFNIVNYPYICSKIPTYIWCVYSQLIRIS